MIKRKLKKGNIGIVVLVVLTLFVSIMLLLDSYERHTLYLKRQNLQNVLTSGNLALYNAVRKGDYKELVPHDSEGNQVKYTYNPQQIREFYDCFNQPNEEAVLTSKYTDYELGDLRDKLVNLSAISYLTEENNYKCIHLYPNEALEAFATYLEDNLDLIADASNTYFTPKNETQKFIKSIKINEFYVRNAVSVWDDTQVSACCDYVKNSQYTAVHIDLEVQVKTFTHLDVMKSSLFGGGQNFAYGEYTTMPMHIDTQIDFNNIINN